ncbi:MAG: FxsA family protein [Epsilonproteobacteria bacterium]|uniref:Exlusion protein FxsA n=1 Tax=Sulfurospirillum cavolei TaxID=366522 RepID=A0A2D3WAJ1_9BACT|nr:MULTISPECIES: FxsA family protein [Sulfurospirillum]MCP3651059.1 FxsA family protein [Sulfurospirillum sp. DNRA8]NCB54608.1 FxsA family protein [Campylobacterota bacterium]KHG34234.1 MAG: exlusion protein FxsA [Sulfurospirillum sp. MES]MCD8544138.1 FxsA family protein [Sulfurospirillum cavolei]MCR1809905.1 FxsA family protein [Sulfurospirillum sp. DNRA8]
MKYFLIYLFLEVVVTVNMTSWIGAVATFVEMVFSALVGLIILANMRVTLMQNMNALMQGEISLSSFQRLNLWTIVGAILLILPGFLGDIVGLLLQFSSMMTLIVSKLLHVGEEKTTPRHFSKGNHDEIIDVEVIDDSRTLK